MALLRELRRVWHSSFYYSSIAPVYIWQGGDALEPCVFRPNRTVINYPFLLSSRDDARGTSQRALSAFAAFLTCGRSIGRHCQV